MLKKIANYISESFHELKTNVTWTKWSEIQRLTVIVAVFSSLFALSVFLVDKGLEVVIENIYSFIQ